MLIIPIKFSYTTTILYGLVSRICEKTNLQQHIYYNIFAVIGSYGRYLFVNRDRKLLTTGLLNISIFNLQG
uniref:Uncharacterized protein n=1 Tax=Setaria italica TaxID=4555 RepID=K3YBF6_SETIT